MTAARSAFEKSAATSQVAGSGKRPPTLTAPVFKLEKVCRSYRKKRRGTSVIESPSSPNLHAALVQVTETGGMVMGEQILTKASRKAARRTTHNRVAPANATPVVQGKWASPSVCGGTMPVTPSRPSDAAFGDPVTHSVRIPFNQVTWLPKPMNVGEAKPSTADEIRRDNVS